ncbi:hypothetical protein GUY61_37000, partial [Streptomyces sp. GC420]|nr:hypothetical protein [Streptomyces sp. GC420]
MNERKDQQQDDDYSATQLASHWIQRPAEPGPGDPGPAEAGPAEPDSGEGDSGEPGSAEPGAGAPAPGATVAVTLPAAQDPRTRMLTAGAAGSGTLPAVLAAGAAAAVGGAGPDATRREEVGPDRVEGSVLRFGPGVTAAARHRTGAGFTVPV